MADMYTPEEIQEIFDAYNKELAETGKVSAAMNQQFADATKGVKNYTYNLKQSLDKLCKLSENVEMNQIEFQKLVGIIEVLGELIIKQK